VTCPSAHAGNGCCGRTDKRGEEKSALEYECELGSFEIPSRSMVIRTLMTTPICTRFALTVNMKLTSLVHIACPD
jgi:hypothetical protein